MSPRDGRDGRDGIDGQDGAVGARGDMGPQGPQGRDGPIGPQGPEGPQGPIGPQGPEGAQGEPGRDGAQGLPGKPGIPGAPGSRGADGAQGQVGANGPMGPEGPMGPMPAHRWSGTSLQFEQPNGNWGVAVDLKGPPGPQSYIGGGSISTGVPEAPIDGTSYARKDAGWVGIGSGGTAEWGNITGTLSAQTDLASALSGKATAAQGALADSAVQPGDLATVATTGAYSDLTDKPTILPDAPSDGSTYGRKDGGWEPISSGGSPAWGAITGTLSDQTDLQASLDDKADAATTLAGYGITDAATSAQGAAADSAVQPGDLATVATSGAYNDLSGKPSLATVATTGAYSDLSGKPTLGTAAAAATTDFATAAQGAKADTATQPAALASAVLTKPECLVVAGSDETTALTTGTAKVTFRMPYAFTVTAVRASLTTAQASGSIFTVDINEGGTTILSTKLTIDNTEKTSTTAAAPPVISDASLADDSEITVDIDQIGNGSAKGLKIYLIGHQ